MPNEENRIILEFPASDVQLELGETITFDNISGFLNSDRVTYDNGSLTEKISALDSEIDSKADAEATAQALATKADAQAVAQAFEGVAQALATKADAQATSQALATKADKVETEQALATKADKADTYTKAQVDALIDELPEPMIFKGTLGVGGTIEVLPAASASNEGWTYKVITDGTYAGQTAKAGDLFTSNGSEWVLIPSADEDNDTWRAIKVNGVEKLGNAISSGNADFVDTENVKAHFDADGNKISFDLDGIDTSAQVDAKVAGLIDDTTPSTEKVYSSSKVAEIVENAVDSVLPTDSVSKSAIATFETDLAKPMSLKAYIEATQDLHGQSAPYPAGGSAQIWNEDWEQGNIQEGTKMPSTTAFRSKDYIECLPNTSYYFVASNYTNCFVFEYLEDKTYANKVNNVSSTHSFTTGATTKYLLFVCRNSGTYSGGFGINYPATDTAYHPYSNICPIGGWDSVKVGYVDFNQLCLNGDFADTSNWVAYLANVFSVADNVGTFKANSGYAMLYKSVSVISGHKYMQVFDVKGTSATNMVYRGFTGGGVSNVNHKINLTTDWQKVFDFWAITENASNAQLKYIMDARSSDFDNIYIKNALFIDLTQAFGEEIADYLYALGDHGESILKQIFTKDYYPYNVGGTMVSVDSVNGEPTCPNVIIPLGQTVYGGYVTQDKAGHRELVVTHQIVDLSTLNWNTDLANRSRSDTLRQVIFIPPQTEVPDCIAEKYIGVKASSSLTSGHFAILPNVGTLIFYRDGTETPTGNFVYKLAEPIIIPLPDGLPLNALIGTNNLFADSGDSECAYKESVELYVQKRIAEVQALVLG